jgi:hypothetical protein
MNLREARSTLIELADVLADWQERLSDLTASLPDPVFEAETDRPLNAAARMLGAIESILLEELASLEQAARSAAGSLDNPTPEEIQVMDDMQTQTTTPVKVMVNTQPQTVTPDQDRLHCLAYHISARILNDAFTEDEAPAVHLIANALELDAGERGKLFDFMQDFIWDLKLRAGEVVDTDEETADFEVTKFGQSLYGRKTGAVILPASLWADLNSIYLALSYGCLDSSAVRELVETDSPDYLELSISDWDHHRLADLILRNSPVLQALKEKAAVALQGAKEQSGP